MRYRRWLAWFLLFWAAISQAAPASLTAAQQASAAKAKRFERAGWTYLHVEGTSSEMGFQHGYFLAKEIAEMLRVHRAVWEYQSGMTWPWLVEKAGQILAPKIDSESLDELKGIVDGLKAAGIDASLNEVIAYNAQLEFEAYWWPLEKKRLADEKGDGTKDRCSAFIATGSWTADGRIVMGHNTMFDYVEAVASVVLDIAPAKGRRLLMQAQPGFIHSGTDFFVTGAGLVGCETTIGEFTGFEANGIPEFVRMRRASQDASNLREWCEIMKKGNNGGYANAWLLGDNNTGEIARLELGLKYTGLEFSKDGYFAGSNVAENRSILRLETGRSPTDIRKSGAARRVRWKQLLAEYKGRINAEAAKKFLADDYDVYLQKHKPGSRCLCAHMELDPAQYGGPEPFDPCGSFDGKVVDAAMAKEMSFTGRWGSPDGVPFSAPAFLKLHPQYDWQEGLLKDRPSQPWVMFRAGE